MVADFEKIGLPVLVLVLLLLFVLLHAMSAETTDRNFRRDHIGYALFSFVFFGILVLRTHISGGRVDILDVVIKTMAFIVLLWVLLWISSGAKKAEKEDYIDERVRLNSDNTPSYSTRSCMSYNSHLVSNPSSINTAVQLQHSNLNSNSNNFGNIRSVHTGTLTSNNAQNGFSTQNHSRNLDPWTIRQLSHLPTFRQHHVVNRQDLFISSEMIASVTPPPAYSSLETLSSEPPPPYEDCVFKEIK